MVEKPPNRGASGIGTGQFTNAEQIRNQFFAHASSQRAGKESGDAGYWTGGRCNWGGSHNLAEDSQALADFFNNVASLDKDIQEMSLAVNEQEFNSRKQQLTSKLQSNISKCNVTSSTSVAGVCIIWDDFFGSFLKPFLNSFQQKLQSQLNQLQNVQPTHQKEILQLEAEIRGAEAKYNEAMANAAKETDPAKKAQFIAIAQAAERTINQAKQKLARNPLSKLAQYSYLNDLGRLIKGNVGPEPVSLPGAIPNPNNSGGSGSGSGGNNPGGGQNPWTPWGGGNGNTTNQQNNQYLILIVAGIAILAFFFLMNQKEET